MAVTSSNRFEVLEVTGGALRSGIVPVPIHAGLTQPEIAYLLEDSGAQWLFSDRAIEPIPGVRRTVVFGDAYERCLHEAEPARIDDVALGRPMHYTSGTTGKPKGVWVKPHSSEEARTRSETFRNLWGIGSDDAHLACSPLTHSAPHRFALRTLEAGGRVALLKKFDPQEALAAIELFSIASTFVVPTHLERILELGKKTLARHDLSSIRLLAHAGAPIRAQTKEAVIELFPSGSVWEFYGSTEGQATRISTREWLRKPGSVGTPNPGVEVLILDENGEALGAGEVGEVWIRDPGGERFEYWGDPAKTRSTQRLGAFTVGDLGRLDEDGYLFLEGRKFDTIITGGVNVYPREVEDVLMTHPAVAEALVQGIPDEEWGQRVHALIVPAFGQPLDVDQLNAWLRERLAGFKCPRSVELVEELPRTPTGKLMRSRAEG